MIALVLTGTALAGVIEPQPKMGDPLPDLTPDELDRFLIGKAKYAKVFLVEEGLGPTFNQNGCALCHNNPFGGPGSLTVTRFGQSGKGGFNGLESLGGSLLQAQGINETCIEEIPGAANVTSPRVTPGALGYGLIEAIEDDDLLALEQDPPGVSGRAHMVNPLEAPGETRVGRFGWKAQVATILTFSGDAALNEMGITNRLVPDENDPNGVNPPSLGDPDFCDTVADPEDGPEGGVPGAPHFIDRITDFQRFLAAPPQTPKTGMSGEAVFNMIGCNECHTPSFTTPDDAGLEMALRNKQIRPYSDFLLHDMGQAGDFIGQGDALPTEIRTPVLWGLRTRDPLWHDGTITGDFETRIAAAITAHGAFGSEGVDSFESWDELMQPDKDALLAFLDSLGRLEFDDDGDGDVELDDFLAFEACIGSGYLPDSPCSVHDIDGDGDVDDDDFESFLLAYEGPEEDCNANTILDIIDIHDGTSADLDGSGRPDECEYCASDITGPTEGVPDGNVDSLDFLRLISQWGSPCGGPCDADITGPDASPDGTVDSLDFLLLIGQWGNPGNCVLP
jgi:CxxC motif-containing protein (DUF1111 family)